MKSGINVVVLDRLEKLRAAGLFTRAQLAKELELSRSMFSAIQAGTRGISVKTERKLREMERRLGLRAPDRASVNETVVKYGTKIIAEAALAGMFADTSKIEEILKDVPNGDLVLMQLSEMLMSEKDKLVARGADPTTIDSFALYYEVAARNIARAKRQL